MSKAIVLIRRNPELTDEKYRELSERRHTPMAAMLPGLQKLVVNQVVQNADDSEPGYDTVMELWFKDSDSCKAALESKQGREVFGEANEVIDPDQIRALLVKELEIAAD